MDRPKGDAASKTTKKKATKKKAARKSPVESDEPAPARKKVARKQAPSKSEGGGAPESRGGDEPRASAPEAPQRSNRNHDGAPDGGSHGDDERRRKDWRKPGKRRGKGRRRRGEGDGDGSAKPNSQPPQQGQRKKKPQQPQQQPPQKAPKTAQFGGGMLVLERGGFGVLRQRDHQYLQSKQDIFVPQRMIQKHKLREGALVEGRIGKGQKHKFQLLEIQLVDGKEPKAWANQAGFKNLTTIDPDFHYAVGDATGNLSMRILDIICPIGRGQRGLIVAPPRAGKTTIMRDFAEGITKGFPEVNLFVLLVDERPEEATEWQRCTSGEVFVSTSDEMAKKHVALAEAVWKRCTRLVELGEDVVLLLDSITRLARAYNNLSGGSGRTMSGGLDSRAMERPRQIFGSARNTETAGSLTILGTTLIETGSRMDSLIFEEFKGTGNMELVLSRKLADRRIFPAIDIERSGTRKEEKLHGMKRLKRIHTLRRVLARMNFIEAMELLITKLDEVETNDDFLKRFEVDPEA